MPKIVEKPMNKLNSEELFPVEILSSSNTVFDTVVDAESHVKVRSNSMGIRF